MILITVKDAVLQQEIHLIFVSVNLNIMKQELKIANNVKVYVIYV